MKAGRDLKIVLWLCAAMLFLSYLGIIKISFFWCLTPLLVMLALTILSWAILIIYLLISKPSQFWAELHIRVIMYLHGVSKDEAGIKYFYIQKRKEYERRKHPKP